MPRYPGLSRMRLYVYITRNVSKALHTTPRSNMQVEYTAESVSVHSDTALLSRTARNSVMSHMLEKQCLSTYLER